MNQQTPAFFKAPHGTKIGYFRTIGEAPTVIFMGGLMSDMSGTKALFLENWCREKGQAFLRFDYAGHGASSGSFEEGTIGSWHRDTLAAIDHLTEGPLVLVGSSMGGWQVLLAALARKDRVVGLVGLAPAPDFTERILWANLEETHIREMMENGKVLIPSEYGDEPYIFTKGLIEDGRQHLLLDDPIDLDIPVRLIHGTADNDVPYQISLDIIAQLEAKEAELVLIKGANHKLSSPEDLAHLTNALESILEKVKDEN